MSRDQRATRFAEGLSWGRVGRAAAACCAAVVYLAGATGQARAAFAELETINVVGFGAVDTESTYIPNVVFFENGAASFEALKAQAVAARSFAYHKIRTSGSITNGTGDQVFFIPGRGGPSEIHRRAAEETAGQILSFRDTLVAAFFVAGAIPSGPTAVPNPGDPDPTDTEKWVTFPLVNNELGVFNLGTPLGFQGTPSNPFFVNRGAMSQNGADFMSDRNVHYLDILKFYYGADIQLETVRATPGTSLGFKNLTDFERNDGFLSSAVGSAPGSRGIGAGSSAVRTSADARTGSFAQRIDIDYDPSQDPGGEGFLLRHISGVQNAQPFLGEPTANVLMEAKGSVGFWIKTDTPGIEVALGIDHGFADDRSLFRSVPADGEWTRVQWFFDEPEQWLSGGPIGTIDGQFSLDSVLIRGDGDATVLLDDLFWNPDAEKQTGDLNGDGFVGAADLDIVLANWNQSVTPGDASRGDLFADGFIGAADLDVLLLRWNFGFRTPLVAEGASAALVPEPGSAALVAAGLMGLVRRRR